MQTITTYLGALQEKVDAAIALADEEKVIERIFQKDHTVWSEDPTEISNRLGWLDSVANTSAALDEINAFVSEIKAEGFTHGLLLGMGGSSLCPEVLRFTYGVGEGALDLAVLDSTDPGAILKYTNSLDPAKTLYIVSTKSGGTVETLSFMKYFYTYVKNKLGADEAAKHFMAITDPGSGLEQMAKDLNFRKIFINDPNIGGRYSALSFFGMVPAALLGMDMPKFLKIADEQIANSKLTGIENKGALLGVIMSQLAKLGKDKVTLVTSKSFETFGGWVEQLIAESTGKIGKGILPVDLEEVVGTEFYGSDRVFVQLKLKGEDAADEKIEKIIAAGIPTIKIELDDIYDLAGQFFMWEIATIVAGWDIAIQPFDQPNVESAKVVARQMVKEYFEKGVLPSLEVALEEDGIAVIGDVKSNSLSASLTDFLAQAEVSKTYVAIQAYVNPTKENWDALQVLRGKIQKQYKVATTLGLGPRFLHSTGQLHKGDAGNGLFIQITSEMPEDAAIPDNAGEDTSSMSFAVLKDAQALGDRQALLDNNRKVIRYKVSSNIVGGVDRLSSILN